MIILVVTASNSKLHMLFTAITGFAGLSVVDSWDIQSIAVGQALPVD